MKKLPTGRQNFAGIIEEDLLYVDKTQQIHRLISNGKLYFLSRPRRFGKSLLISTLNHLFLGRKLLFQDLYIGKETDYSWDSYPVLQFNFATYGHRIENLRQAIKGDLEKYAVEFDVEITGVNLALQFHSLVEKIAQKGKPVVILVDEYDKPIVDFLTQTEQAQTNQYVLRDFFSPLKDLEAKGHLHFLFITGVSKFSKVSLFSDLNNLIDLSIHPYSHDLLGITHHELLSNFSEYIQYQAAQFNMTDTELLEAIKEWYNGYSYDGRTFLYNPFSILNFFSQDYFGNFWFATGTPTFLVNSIRDRGVNPKEFENQEVDSTFFEKFSLEKPDLTGLLFQTGYLTIKETQKDLYGTRYVLNYPNLEVRKSILHNLIEAFSYKESSTVSRALIKMERGLKEGKIEDFIEQLSIIFADISYHLLPKKNKAQAKDEFKAWEGYFHTVIYLITSYMRLRVQAEVTTYQGRLDLLVESEDYIYLMEFKLNESAQNAIQQIKEKKYMHAYQNSPKKIFLVGIGFSTKERNVENWESEVWNRT